MKQNGVVTATSANNMTNAEVENYAWFIYSLICLLSLAICFICVMIVVRCVQLCAESATDLCCHKEGGSRSRTSSSSSSSSYTSEAADDSDSMTTTTATTSSSVIVNEVYVSTQSIQPRSKIKKPSFHYTNKSYLSTSTLMHPDPGELILNANSLYSIGGTRKAPSNVINRKYDDSSRCHIAAAAYVTAEQEKKTPPKIIVEPPDLSSSKKVKQQEQQQTTSTKKEAEIAVSSSSSMLVQLLKQQDDLCDYLNLSPRRSRHYYSLFYDNSSAHADNAMACCSSKDNDPLKFLVLASNPNITASTTTLVNVEEIPPTYEQAVNESTV